MEVDNNYRPLFTLDRPYIKRKITECIQSFYRFQVRAHPSKRGGPYIDRFFKDHLVSLSRHVYTINAHSGFASPERFWEMR